MAVTSLAKRCGDRLQRINEDLQRRSWSDQVQCHVEVETSKTNLHRERAQHNMTKVELVEESDKCDILRKVNEELQISARKMEKHESDLIDQCNALTKANEELRVSGRKMEMEMMTLRKRRSFKREHRDEPKPDDSYA